MLLYPGHRFICLLSGNAGLSVGDTVMTRSRHHPWHCRKSNSVSEKQEKKNILFVQLFSHFNFRDTIVGVGRFEWGVGEGKQPQSIVKIHFYAFVLQSGLTIQPRDPAALPAITSLRSRHRICYDHLSSIFFFKETMPHFVLNGHRASSHVDRRYEVWLMMRSSLARVWSRDTGICTSLPPLTC